MTDKKDYMTIEESKAQKDTSNAVFAGVKTANGWGTGKMVTEQEYDAAVKAFNDAPILKYRMEILEETHLQVHLYR